MAKALLIVDVQYDFVEGGSLGVEGGKAVAKRVAEYVTDYASDFDLIVTSQDWHEPDSSNGGHFHDNPDFAGTWPHHCVQGTKGADLVDDVVYALARLAEWSDTPLMAVRKGQGEPAYSAFEGTIVSPDEAERMSLFRALKHKNVTDLVVVGIATDYCVKATAIDAVNVGLKTTVLANLTAPVSATTALQAVHEMRDAGVSYE